MLLYYFYYLGYGIYAARRICNLKFTQVSKKEKKWAIALVEATIPHKNYT